MTRREGWIERAGLRAIAVGEPDEGALVVVLLHGFRMRPADLAPFAHSLGVDAWFLFPEGPKQAQPDGRAWWHIDPVAREVSMARGPRDFATLHPDDLAGARDHLGTFLRAVERDRAGRPLVLGGFSQGGMVALDTVLRGTCAIDALALMSTSRIAFDEWEPLLDAGSVARLPCLVTHGRADPDLAFGAGEALHDALVGAGASVRWLPFDGGHELPLVVWRALRRFLVSLLGSA